MGECTFWCRIKGAGHKMKYLHAQSMHKVCTKYAQGCIQAIHTAKCANYASMHMPATCTGLHNLQSVRVHKFMCLHNICPNCKVCKSAKYANSVQCAKCMFATYEGAQTHLPV